MMKACELVDAGLLKQLADAASGDISLQHIYVSGQSMDVKWSCTRS